ncbi:hypothetical protein QFZ97_004552 [Paraburkholderia youngii]
MRASLWETAVFARGLSMRATAGGTTHQAPSGCMTGSLRGGSRRLRSGPISERIVIKVLTDGPMRRVRSTPSARVPRVHQLRRVLVAPLAGSVERNVVIPERDQQRLDLCIAFAGALREAVEHRQRPPSTNRCSSQQLVFHTATPAAAADSATRASLPRARGTRRRALVIMPRSFLQLARWIFHEAGSIRRRRCRGPALLPISKSHRRGATMKNTRAGSPVHRHRRTTSPNCQVAGDFLAP